MGHLLNILDLSVEEIDQLIATADAIMENPEDYQNACQNKILATLFFEPSTRTRLSFESAMLGLGGRVLGFSDSSSSSARKGESVADTIAVVSAYADIIAMRHPKEGAPLIAANHTRVPIINGGDGGHWHPTQTLTDLLTIRHEKGRLEGLTIGLCGDLKFGRTVHSLIEAMSRYDGVRFVLISPQELALPGVPLPGGGHRGAGYPLYDPHPAGALCQRRGVPAPEGQLHPHPGKDGAGKGGYDCYAPPAAGQRNRPPGG